MQCQPLILYTVGYQMIETLVENKNLFKKEAKKVSIKTLEKMNINAPVIVQ